MGSGRNTVRIEESSQELDELERLFDTWIRGRRDDERAWRYRTQLASLETVVGAAIATVRQDLCDIDASASSGEVYERCRESDGRVLFVRRFWSYFRERWDQRDDKRFAALLIAAEEVVWSCYAGPFRRLGVPLGPAPLPFVDYEFSPHAIPRERPPLQIKTTDDLLRDVLARMPVPMIGLPPISARHPWWLALLAHETGHQVQFHLDDTLEKTVRRLVVEAAGRGGGDGAPGSPWGRWSQELFADAFAIASVGEAHLWALDELELATRPRMLAEAGLYPPRLARRYFGEHVLAVLEEREPGSVPVPDVEGDDKDAVRVRSILTAVPEVAKTLVDDELGTFGRMRDSADWRPGWFTTESDVEQLSRRIAGGGALFIEAGLESARVVAAAAVAIGREIGAEADDARAEARQHTAPRILTMFEKAQEPGDRADDEIAPSGADALAAEVAGQLRRVAVGSA